MPCHGRIARDSYLTSYDVRILFNIMKKMDQRKVSKRKHVNLKLDENEGETRKDIRVPDNAEVCLLLHIFSRALV